MKMTHRKVTSMTQTTAFTVMNLKNLRRKTLMRKILRKKALKEKTSKQVLRKKPELLAKRLRLILNMKTLTLMTMMTYNLALA